jgi:NAD(P)-dependent dehydrogenase (short-subunit alcohol dehydrogenase family)
MKNKIKGKWAMVTGASRGIGQKISEGLAKEGCNLYLHARSKDNLKKTVELVKPYNVEIFLVEGELSSKEAIQDIIKQVKSHGKSVDILYNNAAVMSEYKSIYEVSQDHWEKVMQINLYSMINFCSAFVPGMVERKFGRVINTTSGIKDQPNLAAYGVSKAAVDKYTSELAFEVKGKNVLVNTIDPGWLKTDLGGPNADNEVDTVMPGVLVPALLEDNGPSGRMFCAQDFKYLSE